MASCADHSFAKSVSDVKGRIWFHSEFQQYAIHRSIPCTYDSQDIGILCSVPENFKTDGLEVVFGADYYHYNGEELPEPAGVTYYYLELKKIQLPWSHHLPFSFIIFSV